MASSKEIQQPSRPLSTGGRHHSHSVSSGSLNATHRVTRRKSITNNAAAAAVVAAVEGTVPIPVSARRNTVSRAGGQRSGSHYPSPPSSLPYRSSMAARKNEPRHENAIDDEDDDESTSFPKARMRRASEGQHLTKEGKKSGHNELVCETCSKKYKHSSCLSKHLWEHTPEWAYTSKLLISKHQQVQLLEAASVLVAMNKDTESPPDSARDFQSDRDSASPSASGSSAHRDGQSSADTTPPPQSELSTSYTSSAFGHAKRYSTSSNFSRSYQSAPLTNPLYAGSAPNGSGFGHFRQNSQDHRRPPSSGICANGQEDEAGLAAAVELLSCSFGTPKTNPVLGDDVPPVPPLPEKYLSQSALSTHGLTPTRRTPLATESYTRGHIASKGDGDVKMEESGGESIMDEDDYDSRYRRQDDEDEGVFGRMEE